MLEIELNVITSDVGGHGDDRSSVELADEVACRHTVQIGHDDIHQNQVVFRTTLHLVHGFQAVKLREPLAVAQLTSAQADVPLYQ